MGSYRLCTTVLARPFLFASVIAKQPALHNPFCSWNEQRLWSFWGITRMNMLPRRLIGSGLFLVTALLLTSGNGVCEEPAADGKLNIICFGAHPDDAEYKSGGTAALWAASRSVVSAAAFDRYRSACQLRSSFAAAGIRLSLVKTDAHRHEGTASPVFGAAGCHPDSAH